MQEKYNSYNPTCQPTNKTRLSITRFKQDVCISFHDGKLVPGAVGLSSTRGNISEWSRESRARYRLVLGNTIQDMSAWIVLTYPEQFPYSGKVAKKHINAFCQWLRRKQIKYVWGLEFQKRGAFHFNFLIDSWISKTELSEAWYRIVDSGDEKHLAGGTRIKAIRKSSTDGLVRYLSAYLAKIDQTCVPEIIEGVGRFWGCSRGLLRKLGVYVRETSGYNDSRRAVRVLRKYYAAKVRQWQMDENEERKKHGLPLKKLFKWTMRKYGGFTMWGCSGGFTKLLEHGAILQVKEAFKCSF